MWAPLSEEFCRHQICVPGEYPKMLSGLPASGISLEPDTDLSRSLRALRAVSIEVSRAAGLLGLLGHPRDPNGQEWGWMRGSFAWNRLVCE